MDKYKIKTFVDDKDHILNITPQAPDYLLLEKKKDFEKYINRLKKDILGAIDREYFIHVSKDKSKIIIDVNLF